MGDEVYELPASLRLLYWVGMPIVWLVLVLLQVRSADIAAIPFVLLLGSCIAYPALWLPYRITVNEAGLVLKSPVRSVLIPWGNLLSVERVFFGQRVLWQRAEGPPVASAIQFTNIHRLLTTIERRASHVQVHF